MRIDSRSPVNHWLPRGMHTANSGRVSQLLQYVPHIGMAGVSPGETAPVESGEHTMSMQIVQGIVAAVERIGVPRRRYLRAAELDEVNLEHPEQRLDREDIFRLTELALDITADPAFGLHWCEGLSQHSFALLSNLLAHAPTLRNAFETLFQFGELLNDDMQLELVERDGAAILRCDGPIGNSLRYERIAAEMVTLGMYSLIRQFDPSATFERVSFTYAAPDYRREYTRVFASGERFSQPFTGLVFDAALLDAQSPYRDEALVLNLRSVAEQRIARLRRTAPYWQQVSEFLRQQPAPHRVTIAQVAQALSLSERSLQRHLAMSGRSYSAIAHSVAAATATCLLEERLLSIKQTAHEMGFSEPSSFHRAFKRWTGKTPSAMRARTR
jgi:AraC-like DNA-binding protein